MIAGPVYGAAALDECFSAKSLTKAHTYEIRRSCRSTIDLQTQENGDEAWSAERVPEDYGNAPRCDTTMESWVGAFSVFALPY